MAIAKSFNRDP